MAAGLYIHILDDVDERRSSALAASAEGPFLDLSTTPTTNGSANLAERLDEDPRVHLGDGPWGAGEADERPVPAPLARIQETVAAGPRLVDDDYIATILIPFDRLDETPYRLGRPGEIWRFLRRHEGKRAVLAVHPDAGASSGKPDVAVESDAAVEPDVATAETATSARTGTSEPPVKPEPEPIPETPLPHDPAFRRPVPTIDGVRPLALVLVTTQQRAPGPATLQERIYAALATIGTFGAGLAAAAGLNNLIR